MNRTITIKKSNINNWIKTCEMNIKKIEKHNNQVGSMFDKSKLPYTILKQFLILLKDNNVHLRRYKSIEELRYYNLDDIFMQSDKNESN